MSLDAGLVWFRRDLRLTDHAALAAALGSCRRVHCVFVYDRPILDDAIKGHVLAQAELLGRYARE
jgi:deoxyribodipyrimidine photolyase